MGVSSVMISAAILASVGLTFGILIAVVHRKFKVWEDPRIEAVAGLLPGSNCGACGFAGCRGFAEGLVAGTVQPASCTQLGTEGVNEVAGFLGVEAGTAVKRVARLLCAGGSHAAVQYAEYRGLGTCAAAAAVAGGGKACTWGCLGLGDCQAACDYDAIVMNSVSLPVVVPERCIACNDCVEACPLDLFTLMPVDQKLIVQCKNLLEGEAAEAVCQVACNGCARCVQDAEPGVIAIVNGLAVIDYAKNELANAEAIARCPTGAIVWVEGAQFAELNVSDRNAQLIGSAVA